MSDRDLSAIRLLAEQMGLFLEQVGWPRMSGRVLGWMLLSDEQEISLDELADSLNVSKASVSGATRLLEQIGAIERVPRCGTRKAYYRLADDVWGRLISMEKRISDTFVGFADQARERLERNPERDARLAEMRRAFELYSEMLDRLISRWREERKRS